MSKLFGGIFNDQKADLNEDVNKMVIYIQKYYSPANRVKLLQGVKDGLEKGLERERDTATETKENAEFALGLIKTV